MPMTPRMSQETLAAKRASLSEAVVDEMPLPPNTARQVRSAGALPNEAPRRPPRSPLRSPQTAQEQPNNRTNKNTQRMSLPDLVEDDTPMTPRMTPSRICRLAGALSPGRRQRGQQKCPYSTRLRADIQKADGFSHSRRPLRNVSVTESAIDAPSTPCSKPKLARQMRE
jgi:hypothetical protein